MSKSNDSERGQQTCSRVEDMVFRTVSGRVVPGCLALLAWVVAIIDTAPDIQFRTTLSQNLQADAHLNLRGTPAHTGMIGRVNITQGYRSWYERKGNRCEAERIRPDGPAEADVSVRPSSPVHRDRCPSRLRQSADLRPGDRRPAAGRALAALRAIGLLHFAWTGGSESGLGPVAAPFRGEQAEDRPADHGRAEDASSGCHHRTADHAKSSSLISRTSRKATRRSFGSNGLSTLGGRRLPDGR